MQGHRHTLIGSNGWNYWDPAFARSDTARGQGTYYTSSIVSDGANGIPRISAETRGKNTTIRLWKRIN